MSQLTRRLSQFDESCYDCIYWKITTESIQFLIYVSWCPLCSIKTRNSYMQCKKKKKKISNLIIFQDFSDARPMPFTPYLQSRFVSIKINEFRISKTFNSCLACLPVRSWIQLLYPPSWNLQFMALQGHLKEAKCFLWCSILYNIYFLTNYR